MSDLSYNALLLLVIVRNGNDEPFCICLIVPAAQWKFNL